MPPGPLTELSRLFLRLGLTAFGGPAAHIAMMRQEVVERHRWLTDREFLDLLAATNLIPGPNSTEMAIHVGFRRAGVPGLLVAGACFILPASLIVLAIAWTYVRYGHAPQAAWLMYGIGPVIIAIIVDAVWKLGRTAVTGPVAALIGAAVCGLSLAGANELVLLAAGGLASIVVWRIGSRGSVGPTAPSSWLAAVGAPTAGALGVLAGSVTLTAAAAAPAVEVTLTRLTLFFLKVGSILFGSGYVLLAFLRADLTERWGWLTDQQLIDAITVGQFTPGPLFTTATFIGYLVAGWAGALLATIGIFTPGFVFVWAIHPVIPRLRDSRAMAAVLDGVVASSLGLMAAVTWFVGRAAIVDLTTLVLGLAALAALWTMRLNSTWLVLAGAAAGWALGRPSP